MTSHDDIIRNKFEVITTNYDDVLRKYDSLGLLATDESKISFAAHVKELSKKINSQTSAILKNYCSFAMKNIRQTLNMNVEEFSKVSGLSKNIIANIEQNKSYIGYEQLMDVNIKLNQYIINNNSSLPKDFFLKTMTYQLDVPKENEPRVEICKPFVTVDTSYSMTNTVNFEKEKLYSIFEKLSKTDQVKIMERMEYIISTYKDEENIPTKRIAVLGQTACGNPIEAISIADEFVETNELKATFALRAVGDSMSPLINDGDVILIKQTEDLEVSDIGIFQINETGFSDDEEVTCKMLKSIKDGVMTLVPLNPAYDPIVVDTKKNHVKVIGKYLGRA